MKTDDIKWVENCTVAILGRIFEMNDAENIKDLLLDEIVEDIDESADKDFNSCDIEIAVARVIKNHLNID